MNVIDSSAWLEYFANGPNAEFFSKAIEAAEDLVVPSITIYEVFKRILQQSEERHALEVIAVMRQGTVVDLDEKLALVAAQFGILYGIPMADSIILATARSVDGLLWTQDSDFENLEGVRYRERQT